jgi:hypothetical protein
MSNPLSSAAPAPMDAAPAAANNGPSQQQQPGGQMPQLHPDDLPKHIDDANYMMPIMSKLARDPKVTRKDVVKAVSGGMADGKFTAQEAIELLSQVPSNPEALKAFLRQRYTALIKGAVHLNAASSQAMQQQRGG